MTTSNCRVLNIKSPTGVQASDNSPVQMEQCLCSVAWLIFLHLIPFARWMPAYAVSALSLMPDYWVGILLCALG